MVPWQGWEVEEDEHLSRHEEGRTLERMGEGSGIEVQGLVDWDMYQAEWKRAGKRMGKAGSSAV